MTLVATPAIQDAVEQLEREAREEEQSAQEKREAAQTLRKTFGMTARQLLTAPAPPAVASSHTSPVIHRESRPAPDAGALPPAQADLELRILGILRASGPMAPRALVAQLGKSAQTVKRIVARLIVLRQVQRTGNTVGVRWSVVTPSGSAAPAPISAPPASPRWMPAGEIRAKVIAALVTESLKLTQIVAALGPSARRADVSLVLQHLSQEGVALSDDDRRYKLTAKPAAPPVKQIHVDAARVNLADARHELLRILNSGASYDFNELVRNMKGRLPNAALVTLLDDLAAEKVITKIALGSTTRFRKAA